MCACMCVHVWHSCIGVKGDCKHTTVLENLLSPSVWSLLTLRPAWQITTSMHAQMHVRTHTVQHPPLVCWGRC